MEIGLVSGIHVLPAIKVRPLEPGPAVLDIANAAQTGYEMHSDNGGKAAGGHDDDEALDAVSETGTTAETEEPSGSSQINCIA